MVMPSRSRVRLRAPIVLSGALALTAVAALGWAARSGTALVHVDLAVVRAMHAGVFADATAAASAITDLAATRAILLTAAIVALALLALRHRRGALSVLLAVALTQAVVQVLKELVERGRPPDSIASADPAGYSFPSAHSASAMAVYGLLALVAARHVRGWVGATVCCAAAAIVAGVGLTRVYLGAHYPSDVVAGWLVGALVAGSAWWLVGRAWRAPIAASPR